MYVCINMVIYVYPRTHDLSFTIRSDPPTHASGVCKESVTYSRESGDAPGILKCVQRVQTVLPNDYATAKQKANDFVYFDRRPICLLSPHLSKAPETEPPTINGPPQRPYIFVQYAVT